MKARMKVTEKAIKAKEKARKSRRRADQKVDEARGRVKDILAVAEEATIQAQEFANIAKKADDVLTWLSKNIFVLNIF